MIVVGKVDGGGSGSGKRDVWRRSEKRRMWGGRECQDKKRHCIQLYGCVLGAGEGYSRKSFGRLRAFSLCVYVASSLHMTDVFLVSLPST